MSLNTQKNRAMTGPAIPTLSQEHANDRPRWCQWPPPAALPQGGAWAIVAAMVAAPRIRKLSPLLVNKIAAGEVVERPASVVKELMENAMDAGHGVELPSALNIDVTIERGGIDLVRVTDNGCGMSSEDLQLSVVPHATSKIVREEDLHVIDTMGFRGEALASIGSISRLSLVSRLHDSDEGHEVRIAGDEFEPVKPVGCSPGTTVQVRDLFFNIPVRRKFLKTPATEIGHINEQFTRASLAHPGIGFSLTHNGRVSFHLPPCQERRERIARFYGAELSEALIPVLRDERGTCIEAYIAPPAQSRATGNWQYLFVNGRYIRDRFVGHAIKEAYRGLIEQRRFPVVFVFLTIDPRLFDVNVHPTKIEVRWADSNLIHSQVLSALKETLQRADLTPAVSLARSAVEVDPAEQDRIRREFVNSVRSAKPIIGEPAMPPPATQTHQGQSPRDHHRQSEATASDWATLTRESQPLASEVVWRSLYEPAQPSESTGQEPASAEPLLPDGQTSEKPRPAIQLHNMYLVVEADDGLLIIDQHALHERIIYEQLRSRIVKGPLESQRLLLPETLQVSAAALATLERHHDLLTSLGIEVSPFGHATAAVHAFPVIVKNVDIPSFVRDLIDTLHKQGEAEHTETVIHRVLDMMACKAAVKAGDPLTSEEIQSLIAQKELAEKSSNCPHGRPTTLRLTNSDLLRQFKRT